MPGWELLFFPTPWHLYHNPQSNPTQSRVATMYHPTRHAEKQELLIILGQKFLGRGK